MKSLLITLLLFTATFSFSQEPTEETNSIENQFDKIYRVSTTYQSYKVISKDSYQSLKSNVLDSLKSSKMIISKKDILLNAEKENIEKNKILLSKTQLDLEAALIKENSISVAGLQLSKVTYNLILWSIVIILLLALSYFIFKFTRSNVLTREAKDNLAEIEEEFEKHRKNTLDKEQKLRRQLQDEINKQRNS
ncbi:MULTISPECIES: hypothetical protein [unclassified Polaribacter]|uniref:hypothetical protein n=1 Tax=unclassified Polaribacter TaxID=196858 RepID=UPI001C4E58B6|nr:MULTISPECIES: hypothetical protein [unclassified Polaribacter]QXP63167.1 hypothetical protein H0I27_15155 [Polaribacter sp. HaHaR_3_91]QXP65678.1 hypothetical protein H0I28_10700 [Polaribacter sp. AHE13PA]QXP71199.1 hypothetical protein H0I29_03680 [Polaribacter sp. R2A056_3_33]